LSTTLEVLSVGVVSSTEGSFQFTRFLELFEMVVKNWEAYWQSSKQARKLEDHNGATPLLALTWHHCGDPCLANPSEKEIKY
jgi:hypothetical protein